MKFLRIAALIICLACVLSLFGACGKKGNESGVPGGDALSTETVNFLDADGESTYVIVRPADSSTEMTKVSGNVKKGIKTNFGVDTKNLTDDTDGTDVAEILIGDTNRPATKTARDYLVANATGRADEYVICTVGEDIVILGITEKATVAAVDYFIDNILPKKTIEGGIKHIQSNPDKYSNITLFGKENLYGVNIVTTIYNNSYITQLEIDKLVEKVESVTGYYLVQVADQVASKTGNNLDGSGTLTRANDAEYEIIIGNCVRDGVSSISKQDEYEIRIEDKKVYLNGGSPYATALAVTEFTKLISAGAKITAQNSVSGGDYESVVETYDSATYYYPTFKEDFNVSSIDKLTMWKCRWDEATGYQENGKSTYRGSSELQNNYISNGKLYMAALNTDKGYYGGMIDTKGKFAYLYGYIEISDMHPKGDGFWTSLWTVSEGNSQFTPMVNPNGDYRYYSETDVDECYGSGTYAYGNTFCHPTGVGKDMGLPVVHVKNTYNSNDDRGFYMDFHTYGYEWVDNTTVRFICDGKVYKEQILTADEQEAYSQPQWLKVSLAVGAKDHALTTNPDDWQETNKFITDWVYIYQKRGQKTFYGGGSDWETNWQTVERH